jgi:hypothetical protein
MKQRNFALTWMQVAAFLMFLLIPISLALLASSPTALVPQNLYQLIFDSNTRMPGLIALLVFTLLNAVSVIFALSGKTRLFGSIMTILMSLVALSLTLNVPNFLADASQSDARLYPFSTGLTLLAVSFGLEILLAFVAIGDRIVAGFDTLEQWNKGPSNLKLSSVAAVWSGIYAGLFLLFGLFALYGFFVSSSGAPGVCLYTKAFDGNGSVSAGFAFIALVIALVAALLGVLFFVFEKRLASVVATASALALAILALALSIVGAQETKIDLAHQIPVFLSFMFALLLVFGGITLTQFIERGRTKKPQAKEEASIQDEAAVFRARCHHWSMTLIILEACLGTLMVVNLIVLGISPGAFYDYNQKVNWFIPSTYALALGLDGYPIYGCAFWLFFATLLLLLAAGSLLFALIRFQGKKMPQWWSVVSVLTAILALVVSINGFAFPTSFIKEAGGTSAIDLKYSHSLVALGVLDLVAVLLGVTLVISSHKFRTYLTLVSVQKSYYRYYIYKHFGTVKSSGIPTEQTAPQDPNAPKGDAQ